MLNTVCCHSHAERVTVFLRVSDNTKSKVQLLHLSPKMSHCFLFSVLCFRFFQIRLLVFARISLEYAAARQLLYDIIAVTQQHWLNARSLQKIQCSRHEKLKSGSKLSKEGALSKEFASRMSVLQ